MPTLEDAILLAVRAHKGLRDKADAPYILHPLRVMQQMDSDVERIAAVLHDVIEDTEYSLGDLLEKGYSEAILVALDHLTKREGEAYEDFIDRAGQNAVARNVKIADLRDNLDLDRLRYIKEVDLDRVKRYLDALQYLQA